MDSVAKRSNYELLKISGSSSSDPAILREILQSPKVRGYIRQRALANPASPLDVLSEIARSGSRLDAMAIGLNPSIGEDLRTICELQFSHRLEGERSKSIGALREKIMLHSHGGYPPESRMSDTELTDLNPGVLEILRFFEAHASNGELRLSELLTPFALEKRITFEEARSLFYESMDLDLLQLTSTFSVSLVEPM